MPKKTPVRTCIGCGTIRPKKELIRIVLSEDGKVRADRTGRANGRGAYLCDDPACVRNAVRRRAFQRAFRTPLPAEAFDQLLREPGPEKSGEPDSSGVSAERGDTGEPEMPGEPEKHEKINKTGAAEEI